MATLFSVSSHEPYKVPEKYAGKFPLWLAPVQVAIIPIGDAHHETAIAIADALRNNGKKNGHHVRVELDLTPENFGKKVRKAKTEKIPYTVIIGDKDLAVGKVTLESRDHGNLGQMTQEEVVEKMIKEIAEKK
mgnify:CR=1 FL=1